MLSSRLRLLARFGSVLLFGGLVCPTAQSAPNAAVASASLAPLVRDLNGLHLWVFDAGFGSLADLSSDRAAATNPAPGFYFSYDASLRGAPIGRWNPMVVFNGLFGPDGAPLSVLAQGDRTYFWSDASPAWKSVRAEWEVLDPLASAADAGRFSTHYEFEVALPAPGVAENSIAPPLALQTARGTRVSFDKLLRREKSLVAQGRIERPADVPEAHVSLENVRVSYGRNPDVEGIPGGDDARGDNATQIRSPDAPADAKTVKYEFDLLESARRWRQVGAFQRVSMEIPVAALWRAAPLQPKTPFAPSVIARGADFEARWDAGLNFHGLESNPLLRSRLWLRDLKPDPKSGEWTPTNVEMATDKGPVQLFSWATIPRGMFHSDNALRAPGERDYELEFYAPQNTPQCADLLIKARRMRTQFSTHVLENVPLPARNHELKFGANEFSTGSWRLRRIIWIDDARLKHSIQFEGGAGLMLTFDRDPKTFLAEDQMMMVGTSLFYDEKGLVGDPGTTFEDGDPAEEGHEKDRITLILSPPTPGTTRLSAYFRVRQQVASGEVQTLRLPAVPIGVLPTAAPKP